MNEDLKSEQSYLICTCEAATRNLMHKSGVPHYMYSQTTVLCSADYLDVSATLYHLLDYGFSRAIKYICSDLIL